MRSHMPTFDCIQEYEQARQDRLWDGMTLWLGSRAPGAVYTLGYAAEITVKCAYFRLSGFAISQPIGRNELNTAFARARTLGVGTPHEKYHSIRFWSELLIAHRAAVAMPLATATEGLLRAAVDAVYDRWWVEMRYKRSYSSPADVEQLAVAVDWLDKNYTTLYM